MGQDGFAALLRRKGFGWLLATQFLGAVSDNLYKIVVSLFAADLAIETGAGTAYLSLSLALLVLPFLLFSGYAGWLADAYSKRTILIATKALEILAAVLAFAAFQARDIDLMLGVVFLTAVQSALFSPARYGILPEMFPDRDLSRANALAEGITFLAILLGTVAGSLLFDAWGDRLAWIGGLLVVLAVLGSAASFGIARVPAPAARPPFVLFPWGEILVGLRHLWRHRPLWLTVLGISYFWFWGALASLTVVLFGKQVLGLDDTRTGLLQAAVAVGMGLGCLAAGRLSGDKVELGLVPLGSIGMGIGAVVLGAAVPGFGWSCFWLALAGFSAGLFIVPLNAFLQQRAPAAERGRLIATNNVLGIVGVLLASGLLWLLDGLGLEADGILLVAGLLTFGATAYLLVLLPDFLIRLVLWLVTHSLYRIRVVGAENIPAEGPALLVSNHVSFVDGLLIGATTQRHVRFMMGRWIYETRGLRWLFRLMHVIPIAPGSRKDGIRALAQARAELAAGHVVCIFAEGAISRTGNLLPFKRGFERIVEGLDVPVVPVHLDRVWGSVFSFKTGRFFWKLPERLPYPVTVSVGRRLPSSSTAFQVRRAIQELGADAVRLRRTGRDRLHYHFLRTARRRWRALALADTTGLELSFGRALVGSLLLSRQLARALPQDRMVGVLLPASVAGVLVNAGLLLAGKVPVNLNFTAGQPAMESAIRQCGITTIITARTFLAKAKLPELPGMVFVEAMLKAATPRQKALTAAAAWLLPSWLLAWLYDRAPRDPDALATVLFSSGSTGEPKGVMLSHHNILSNVEGIAQVLALNPSDRIIGVLPFFHAFGITGTLWAPLICGVGAAYHANPVDGKTIGELAQKYQATILISTPTFCQTYIRACPPDAFASIRYAVVGAEKLREHVARAFKEKFGVDLMEGYGMTEMAPVVAVNVPDVTTRGWTQIGAKPGTVGHPLPSTAAKAVDLETGADLPADAEGMLLFKSPARMLGYLNRPEKTEEVLRDGWYVSGDIGAVDEDGFVLVTDRLSRFSKIGGEMVPHLAVEEAIIRIPGIESCAVTAVPDPQRGERLVAFITGEPGLDGQAVAEALNRTDLPKLWLPKAQAIFRLDVLPTLATGKIDLRTLKALAAERAAQAA